MVPPCTGHSTSQTPRPNSRENTSASCPPSTTRISWLRRWSSSVSRLHGRLKVDLIFSFDFYSRIEQCQIARKPCMEIFGVPYPCCQWSVLPEETNIFSWICTWPDRCCMNSREWRYFIWSFLEQWNRNVGMYGVFHIFVILEFLMIKYKILLARI